MARVRIELHEFGSMEDAVRAADDIKNSGSVSYVNAQGADVQVTVGDVTVESGA